MIAKKARRGGGEDYARVGSTARDSVKGSDAKLLLDALKSLKQANPELSHFRVYENNLALYFRKGQPIFIARLEAGLEFPERP